ncbi:MAG: preprotein translocase subunit Tim44 [Acidobacteria bacterium]|nr:MAG: preprotein translocase subunit Tim44 [Acidobacteriota bacterium]
MDRLFTERGFLPARDPLTAFPSGSPLCVLDDIGRDLPSLVEDDHFRTYARALALPPCPEDPGGPDNLPWLRLYYVRVGFLASAYINQTSQPAASVLPQNLAVPLCKVCALLGRPPILSYDGYALYNWKRFDPDKPIALGNIDTLQNFVHLYDEHWFILVHVEIEAIAARILAAIARVAAAPDSTRAEELHRALTAIASAVREQGAVLRRLPEKMDPALYHKTFRPYIRFFENVVYEGVPGGPMNFRGETGAQSSVMPALVAFMKIPHRPSVLTNHLADMRRFMPSRHRELVGEIEAMPSIRDIADRNAFNDVLEEMAGFRETHYKWAQEYINRWTDDPRGTGGTPYMSWLKQLIDETRAHKL